MVPATLEHSTLTDDTDKHAGASGNVMFPVVTVLSVYVPSLFAVHVPVTCSDPVTGTVLHPRLASVTSMFPARARQDDVTLQVPITEPPQGVTPGQLCAPAVPPEPVVLPVPPELAVPPVPPEPVVPPVSPPGVLGRPQPPPATAKAKAPERIRPISLIRMKPTG